MHTGVKMWLVCGLDEKKEICRDLTNMSQSLFSVSPSLFFDASHVLFASSVSSSTMIFLVIPYGY